MTTPYVTGLGFKTSAGAWTVKSASDSFSRLFDAALQQPQVVSRRDSKRVYLVSEEDYRLLEKQLENQGARLIDVLMRMTHDPRLKEVLHEPASYPDLALD